MVHKPSKLTIDFLEMPTSMEESLCQLVRLNVKLRNFNSRNKQHSQKGGGSLSSDSWKVNDCWSACQHWLLTFHLWKPLKKRFQHTWKIDHDFYCGSSHLLKFTCYLTVGLWADVKNGFIWMPLKKGSNALEKSTTTSTLGVVIYSNSLVT